MELNCALGLVDSKQLFESLSMPADHLGSGLPTLVSQLGLSKLTCACDAIGPSQSLHGFRVACGDGSI